MSLRCRQHLPMTVDAVCDYADDALRRAAAGEAAFSFAAVYLLSMLELGASADPRASMLYFVASYTLAVFERDNTHEEALAVDRLTRADAARVAELVRGHAELSRAMQALASSGRGRRGS